MVQTFRFGSSSLLSVLSLSPRLCHSCGCNGQVLEEEVRSDRLRLIVDLNCNTVTESGEVIPIQKPTVVESTGMAQNRTGNGLLGYLDSGPVIVFIATC
jgi:hypothetical protein